MCLVRDRCDDVVFFFQAEDGIRDLTVTGVQTCALPISSGERYEAQVAETQHRVRSGESLSSIASRYGTSIATIAELNNLDRPYRIRAGQEIGRASCRERV